MEKIRLRDVADVITKGTTPTSIGYEFVNKGINFIKVESITEDGAFIENKFAYITDECNKKLSRSQLQENDILFSIAGAIGRVAIVDKNILPANTNQALAIIRLHKGVYEYNFLKYILNSPAISKQFEKQKQGVAQINLSLKNIGNFEIPVISIEQQKKIADEFDKVTVLIDKRKRQLEKLDELVKSRFVEMFGDPVKNSKRLPTVLGETLFRLSNGKALPSNERFPEGIPAYGGNGVSWYTDKILCDFDTIIVGRVGFQSGNVHLAKAPLWVTDNAMYISSLNTEICDMRFLCALMEHIDFTRYQDAGDLKKITQKPFMQMHYPMPSMQAQMQYIDFSKQTDKSKFEIKQSLEKLELLKKALMQKYFG